MRIPIHPLPDSVSRWARVARYLRWLDALTAWIALWVTAELSLPQGDGATNALLAATLTAAGAWVPWLRVRWRPLTAVVGVLASRRLRPGDRAWYVRPTDAQLVLVTACRRLRVVIARAESADEGMSVRRTRVLLLPAD
jgi:hypothetical protein